MIIIKRGINFIIRNPEAVIALSIISLCSISQILQNTLGLSIFMFVCSLIINMSDLLDSEEAKPSFIQRSLQLTKFAALSLKQSTYAFLLAASFYLLGTHAHHILWVGVVPLMGALYCLAKSVLPLAPPLLIRRGDNLYLSPIPLFILLICGLNQTFRAKDSPSRNIYQNC